jgi:hypothetical protein
MRRNIRHESASAIGSEIGMLDPGWKTRQAEIRGRNGLAADGAGRLEMAADGEKWRRSGELIGEISSRYYSYFSQPSPALRASRRPPPGGPASGAKHGG